MPDNKIWPWLKLCALLVILLFISREYFRKKCLEGEGVYDMRVLKTILVMTRNYFHTMRNVIITLPYTLWETGITQPLHWLDCGLRGLWFDPREGQENFVFSEHPHRLWDHTASFLFAGTGTSSPAKRKWRKREAVIILLPVKG